jgi:hypothetical protein
MILTSNQSFGAWGEVFGDRVIATAILDRLLHHAVTLNIRGNSYRLKEKLKAGLVRSHDNTAAARRRARCSTGWGNVVDEKQCFPSWHFDAVLRYTAGTSGWGSPFHSLGVPGKGRVGTHVSLRIRFRGRPRPRFGLQLGIGRADDGHARCHPDDGRHRSLRHRRPGRNPWVPSGLGFSSLAPARIAKDTGVHMRGFAQYHRAA